uniref:Glycosyltransferase 2-like domain-containing protein n=1 Tax=Panagrolaimus davidi TaxID=227884 RepID=A0A914Q996_9BILA
MGPKLLGTFGDYACASMYVNKMLHAGDGGFILSKNPSTQTRLQSILNHGFTRSFHFVHFESSINGKINGLGAAVACGVLENFQVIIERRQAIAQWYRESLAEVVTAKEIELMPECGVGDTPWVFGLHCSTKSMRTALRKHLAENSIETRDYFFPMHLQPAFRKDISEPLQSLPNSEKYGSTGFYLPTHTNMSKTTTKFIGKIICEFFDKKMSNFKTDKEIHEMNGCHTGVNLNSLHENLCDEKANSKIGEIMLRKMRQCFYGQEIWDDKSEILKQFDEYFKNPLAKFDSKKDKLDLFYKYFTSTLNVENVPQDDKTLLKVLQSFPKSVKKDNCEIVYFRKYDNDQSVLNHIKELFEGFKVIDAKIPENGYSIKIPPSMNLEIVIADLTDVTLQEALKIKDIFESEILFCQNLLLTNTDEKMLPFLTELTKHFILQSKHQNIRVLKALSPFVNPETVEWDEFQTQWNTPLPRKLKFVGDPEWNHHHQNAYQSAINALKERFHDDFAEVLFISAVEQYICDCEITPKQPWIGIIHGITKNDKRFYVPDLEKLCTKSRFKSWFKTCVGLFTLTSVQLDYLRNNLWPEFKFPINQLFYPSFPLTTQPKSSTVLETITNNKEVDVYFIGSFDRNFEHFFKVKFPKNMKKILLVCDWETPTTGIPDDVKIVSYADSEEYECILRESIIFLSLKNGGAANTLVIECIVRNIPIVVPKMKSVMDYIGEEYPLLYEPERLDFSDFISTQRVAEAIKYLKQMDKTSLTQNRFVQDFETSAVLSYIKPENLNRKHFDLTISICSYKRTHNLSQILDSLINHQSSAYNFEIIIWNNNNSRRRTVEKIVESFKKSMNNNKIQIELISSSENHVCSVRFAISMLMQSEKLLICDDDIIPGPEYIDFFMKNNADHPRDVLCVRGNKFLPHIMPEKNVHKIWTNYDAFEFLDDFQDECSIHYVHADACLIPKAALLEVSSTCPPDNDFMLIDDYWLSYVLAAKFDRNLRKLKLSENVITRTKDSDQVGIAMYTRKDVANARTRMYIHHMINGWPKFENEFKVFDCKEIKDYKIHSWKNQRIGFNINSEITDEEILNLSEMKFSMVRIGVAGIGRDEGFEFAQLNSEPKLTLDDMEKLIKRLNNFSFDVIIALDKRVASEKNWIMIAERFCHYKNVVGYDLINEPSTKENEFQHWYEIRGCTKMDDSEHFIDHVKLIKALTWRSHNKGRYTFPGDVPIYENLNHPENIHWSPEFIDKEIKFINKWTSSTGIPVFIGEFGITREVKGAELYLKAISNSCKRYNISACLYAYRDPDWEAMDYELGVNASNYFERSSGSDNPLYNVIRKFNTIN